MAVLYTTSGKRGIPWMPYVPSFLTVPAMLVLDPLPSERNAFYEWVIKFSYFGINSPLHNLYWNLGYRIPRINNERGG